MRILMSIFIVFCLSGRRDRVFRDFFRMHFEEINFSHTSKQLIGFFIGTVFFYTQRRSKEKQHT